LSNDDSWFVKKKRLDSLSRSQFLIGDSVVVCNNKHVMLSDFYEGECHTCKDRQTVSFCYANVEYGYKLTDNDAWFIYKNPTDKISKKSISVGDTVVICDNKHMSLITSYSGKCPICESEHTGTIPIRKELFSWLFPTKPTKRLLYRLNFALGWLLGILIIAVFTLILTGIISNEHLVEYWEGSVLPDTIMIFESVIDFVRPINGFSDYFLETSLSMASRNNVLLNELLAVSLMVLNGFASIYIYLGISLQLVAERTEKMFEMFDTQTHRLIDIVTTWSRNLID